MSAIRSIKLGTRSSLLAIAQSRLVADELEHTNPGLSVRIVPRLTRGDRNQAIALSRANDENFFTADLDQALLSGDIDFAVHSLKDLGRTRPRELAIAAIPPRENPRDLIAFRSDVIDRLRQGRQLKIGTSSLRRTRNVGDFLGKALPTFGQASRFEFHDLRGPVDLRLARVAAKAGNEDELDGVVLALAGLNRLWNDADANPTIRNLARDLRWMVLPLSECPAAAGQGALAIECRTHDTPTRAVLETLHDPATAALFEQERDYLSTQAMPNRQSFGATALSNDACGSILWARGQTNTEAMLQQTVWPAPPRPDTARGWDGSEWLELGKASRLITQRSFAAVGAVFVAHWRAVPPATDLASGSTRVWVSGIESWYKLAKRGIWVDGCADNLGFSELQPTISAGVLGLPPLTDWTVLTHVDAAESWADSGIGKVLPTYQIGDPPDQELRHRMGDRIASSTHFYWGSMRQFDALKKWIPRHAHHACGPGKTFGSLQKQGLEQLRAFPSRRDWQRWLS